MSNDKQIEDGDVVEMDEVHYGKRCFFLVAEYHPNTGSIAYEKEQLIRAVYSVLVHDSNVSRVYIEKGKHFQRMREIIDSNNKALAEKDSVIAHYRIGIDDLLNALRPHADDGDVEANNIIASLLSIKRTANQALKQYLKHKDMEDFKREIREGIQ